MDDLEMLGGEGAREEMSEEEFEQFKEKMRAAAQQLKALQKGEQKQKKKEDQLFKILLKLIRDSSKRDIMLLASRCLEQNIPSVFVLSVLLLGNKEIQQELQISLDVPPREAETGEHEEHREKLAQARREIVSLDEHKQLPLNAKIEIDNWIKNLHEQALTNPHKLLENAREREGGVKLILIQLATFVLRDFLAGEKVEWEYEKLKEFIALVLDRIMVDTENFIKTKKLKEE